ncbi:MAG: beta-hydroxyacyl-ACP dehydratase [Desulfobacteraceae bacterium]|jgi:3-hydroxyacyl-[acyl-carrier-protein] dehydratase|nr:MAG: beta-hydroxyacyl-ACP dehydratase [Desulfobacteraceae bacterium]
MADSRDFIYARIPHRPPFLWVDRVVSCADGVLVAEKNIPADLDIFQGHYPAYPILPGVILCEAVFQAGALLIAELLRQDRHDGNPAEVTGVPVLTRINGAKFKREVKPGETITLEVKLNEQVGTVWFLKGRVLVHDKTAVKVDFACAMSDAPHFARQEERSP